MLLGASVLLLIAAGTSGCTRGESPETVETSEDGSIGQAGVPGESGLGDATDNSENPNPTEELKREGANGNQVPASTPTPQTN